MGLPVLQRRLEAIEAAIRETRTWIDEQQSDVEGERPFLKPGDPESDLDYRYSASVERALAKAKDALRVLEDERQRVVDEQAKWQYTAEDYGYGPKPIDEMTATELDQLWHGEGPAEVVPWSWMLIKMYLKLPPDMGNDAVVQAVRDAIDEDGVPFQIGTFLSKNGYPDMDPDADPGDEETLDDADEGFDDPNDPDLKTV